MPIRILNTKNQAVEFINNGEIEESKTVGVSANRNIIKPYSNIFYFSKLWTDVGSSIAERSHKGFEILTYVIKGRIYHIYSNEKTISIHTGDIEHIKSGSGVKHVEKYYPNTKAVQIWMDPNLRASLASLGAVDIHKANKLKLIELSDYSVIDFLGRNGVLKSDLEDTEIKEERYSPGLRTLSVRDGRFLTCFVLKGELEVENRFIKVNDYFIMGTSKN